MGGAFFFFLVFFFFFPFLRTSPILVPPSHPLPFPACFVGFGGEVCVGCSIVAAVFFPLPPFVASRGVSDDAATREALYCATALFLLPFATGRVGGDDGGGGVRALLMPEPGQPSGLDLMDPRRPTDRRRAPSPFEFETGENRDDGRMGVSPAHRPYHGHDHATTRLNPNRRTLQVCFFFFGEFKLLGRTPGCIGWIGWIGWHRFFLLILTLFFPFIVYVVLC